MNEIKSVEFCITPTGRRFNITGSAKDRSVVGAIDSTGGSYEPYLVKLITDTVKPNWTCVDIGANIGVISLVLGNAASNGRVYSFEPSEKNFHFLELNVGQNNGDNITPVNLGLYDKSCELSFSYVEEVAGCSFISSQGVSAGIAEKINCVTLDEWVGERDLKRLDFIKIDVEGSELKALNGGLNTIRSYRPDLVVEFNPGPIVRFSGDDPEKLYELLKNIYPSVYLINDRDSSLMKIKSYRQLENLMSAGKGWEDLYCTFSG